MLTENSTYEELQPAMREARLYGDISMRSEKVRKAIKKGAKQVFHRVRTPQSKQPVLYVYSDICGEWSYRTFLVLKGKEGEGFAVGMDNGSFFEIIHSHAVNRYIERRRFKGTLEEAQHKIVTDLIVHWVEADDTSKTDYVYFDGGVFLCTHEERIIHLRTFIMNRQCHPVQRMKSLRSEKNTKQYKKELGIE